MKRLILFVLLLYGCEDSGKILRNRDFNQGDWLLVNDNSVTETVEIIDEEEILKENIEGLWITPLADCGGTTCDGFLRLYQNGKLIATGEYLSQDHVYESKQIQKAYKKSKSWVLQPVNEADFAMKWDSLIQVKNIYPTVYPTRPEEKKEILVYKK